MSWLLLARDLFYLSLVLFLLLILSLRSEAFEDVREFFFFLYIVYTTLLCLYIVCVYYYITEMWVLSYSSPQPTIFIDALTGTCYT